MANESMQAHFPSDVKDFFYDAMFVKENVDLLISHLTGKLVNKTGREVSYADFKENALEMEKCANRVYLWARGTHEIGLSIIADSEVNDMEHAVNQLKTAYVFMFESFLYSVDNTSLFAALPTANFANTFDRIGGYIDDMVGAIYA